MSDASEEDDLDELKARRICVDCVGDEFLKQEILSDGVIDTCAYCEKPGKTISVEDLADSIESGFERHYRRTSTEPDSFQYSMMKEGDYEWFRGGDEVEYAIADAAQIDDPVAKHVRIILEDRNYDRESAQMGDETPFAADSYYERKDIRDHEFQESWRFFEASVKGTERHFNTQAEQTLDEIFGDLEEHRTSDGRSTIVEAGPGHEIKAFYRARVFQSSPPVDAAIQYPDREIGPPPMADALAGRMNARGVSVFYGATDQKIAIAEVRPPVGSRVVVARFELIRNVRLLDVGALKDVAVEGSVFDPKFLSRIQRAIFLERLANRISMPVMPHDETLDYIVTQVIADYLATREKPVIDGILFPSAQKPGGGSNVVLFHKASAVQREVLPPGSEVSSTQGWDNEEGFDVDYRVWVKVPKDKEKKKHRVMMFGGMTFDPADDYREPTLKLDTSDLHVHHVSAVEYTTASHKVSRHEIEKPDALEPGTIIAADILDEL